VTGLRVGQRRERGWILARGERCFSPANGQDRLWD